MLGAPCEQAAPLPIAFRAVDGRDDDATPVVGRTTPDRPVARSFLVHALAGWVLAQLAGTVAVGVLLAAATPTGTAVGAAVAAVLDGAGDPDVVAGLTVATFALLVLPGWVVQLGSVASATWAAGRPPGAVLGLRIRPVDIPVGLAAGVGAQVLVGVVYRVVDVDAGAPASRLLAKADTPLAALGMAALLVGVAPFVEELVYRGLLQRGLAAFLGAPVALLATAVLFALVHFQPVQFAGLLVAGLVFGVLAEWSGRLGPAIAAHVGFNATTVGWLLLTAP
ncbi:MAG: CPBP family intramembrane metalloprotease [Actinobacteria bacterium]|nr:CPBP family intramembrane metalloprotease [Actinomycetota bacterium]